MNGKAKREEKKFKDGKEKRKGEGGKRKRKEKREGRGKFKERGNGRDKENRKREEGRKKMFQPKSSSNPKSFYKPYPNIPAPIEIPNPAPNLKIPPANPAPIPGQPQILPKFQHSSPKSNPKSQLPALPFPAIFSSPLPWALPSLSQRGQKNRDKIPKSPPEFSKFPENHEWLLSPDVDALPLLLLPLAGPEDLPEEEMERE